MLSPEHVSSPKSSRVSPLLKSLHWFKINKRIHYLQNSSNKPTIYICNFITIQHTANTRSYSMATLRRCSSPSRLQLNDCSFSYYAPFLWNYFRKEFRQPAVSIILRILVVLFLFLLYLLLSLILNSLLSYSLILAILNLLYLWTDFLVLDLAVNFHVINFVRFISFTSLIFHLRPQLF